MPRMRSADRRRQLLEVAAERFAKLGYRGATTADLAKAAGITEPILYRHFKNKLDLFVTLVDEVGNEVIRGWEKALDGEDDPAKRLDILMANNPATHDRAKRIYRVMFQAMTEVEGEPSVARALKQHFKKVHEFIKSELASMQKSGAVRKDESAGDLAWLLINVAVGYGMTNPLGVGGATGAGGRKSGMERLLADLMFPDAGMKR